MKLRFNTLPTASNFFSTSCKDTLDPGEAGRESLVWDLEKSCKFLKISFFTRYYVILVNPDTKQSHLLFEDRLLNLNKVPRGPGGTCTCSANRWVAAGLSTQALC